MRPGGGDERPATGGNGVTDEPFREVRLCIYCGSTKVLRLGLCDVCNQMVCDHCGNTQIAQGKRIVVHNACMHKHEGEGFSMIKFVK